MGNMDISTCALLLDIFRSKSLRGTINDQLTIDKNARQSNPLILDTDEVSL